MSTTLQSELKMLSVEFRGEDLPRVPPSSDVAESASSIDLISNSVSVPSSVSDMGTASIDRTSSANVTVKQVSSHSFPPIGTVDTIPALFSNEVGIDSTSSEINHLIHLDEPHVPSNDKLVFEHELENTNIAKSVIEPNQVGTKIVPLLPSLNEISIKPFELLQSKVREPNEPLAECSFEIENVTSPVQFEKLSILNRTESKDAIPSQFESNEHENIVSKSEPSNLQGEMEEVKIETKIPEETESESNLNKSSDNIIMNQAQPNNESQISEHEGQSSMQDSHSIVEIGESANEDISNVDSSELRMLECEEPTMVDPSEVNNSDQGEMMRNYKQQLRARRQLSGSLSNDYITADDIVLPKRRRAVRKSTNKPAPSNIVPENVESNLSDQALLNEMSLAQQPSTSSSPVAYESIEHFPLKRIIKRRRRLGKRGPQAKTIGKGGANNLSPEIDFESILYTADLSLLETEELKSTLKSLKKMIRSMRKPLPDHREQIDGFDFTCFSSSEAFENYSKFEVKEFSEYLLKRKREEDAADSARTTALQFAEQAEPYRTRRRRIFRNRNQAIVPFREQFDYNMDFLDDEDAAFAAADRYEAELDFADTNFMSGSAEASLLPPPPPSASAQSATSQPGRKRRRRRRKIIPYSVQDRIADHRNQEDHAAAAVAANAVAATASAQKSPLIKSSPIKTGEKRPLDDDRVSRRNATAESSLLTPMKRFRLRKSRSSSRHKEMEAAEEADTSFDFADSRQLISKFCKSLSYAHHGEATNAIRLFDGPIPEMLTDVTDENERDHLFIQFNRIATRIYGNARKQFKVMCNNRFHQTVTQPINNANEILTEIRQDLRPALRPGMVWQMAPPPKPLLVFSSSSKSNVVSMPKTRQLYNTKNNNVIGNRPTQTAQVVGRKLIFSQNPIVHRSAASMASIPIVNRIGITTPTGPNGVGSIKLSSPTPTTGTTVLNSGSIKLHPNAKPIFLRTLNSAEQKVAVTPGKTIYVMKSGAGIGPTFVPINTTTNIVSSAGAGVGSSAGITATSSTPVTRLVLTTNKSGITNAFKTPIIIASSSSSNISSTPSASSSSSTSASVSASIITPIITSLPQLNQNNANSTTTTSTAAAGTPSHHFSGAIATSNTNSSSNGSIKLLLNPSGVVSGGVSGGTGSGVQALHTINRGSIRIGQPIQAISTLGGSGGAPGTTTTQHVVLSGTSSGKLFATTSGGSGGGKIITLKPFNSIISSGGSGSVANIATIASSSNSINGNVHRPVMATTTAAVSQQQPFASVATTTATTTSHTGIIDKQTVSTTTTTTTTTTTNTTTTTATTTTTTTTTIPYTSVTNSFNFSRSINVTRSGNINNNDNNNGDNNNVSQSSGGGVKFVAPTVTSSAFSASSTSAAAAAAASAFSTSTISTTTSVPIITTSSGHSKTTLSSNSILLIDSSKISHANILNANTATTTTATAATDGSSYRSNISASFPSSSYSSSSSAGLSILWSAENSKAIVSSKSQIINATDQPPENVFDSDSDDSVQFISEPQQRFDSNDEQKQMLSQYAKVEQQRRQQQQQQQQKSKLNETEMKVISILANDQTTTAPPSPGDNALAMVPAAESSTSEHEANFSKSDLAGLTNLIRMFYLSGSQLAFPNIDSKKLDILISDLLEKNYNQICTDLLRSFTHLENETRKSIFRLNKAWLRQRALLKHYNEIRTTVSPEEAKYFPKYNEIFPPRLKFYHTFSRKEANFRRSMKTVLRNDLRILKEKRFINLRTVLSFERWHLEKSVKKIAPPNDTNSATAEGNDDAASIVEIPDNQKLVSPKIEEVEQEEATEKVTQM